MATRGITLASNFKHFFNGNKPVVSEKKLFENVNGRTPDIRGSNDDGRSVITVAKNQDQVETSQVGKRWK